MPNGRLIEWIDAQLAARQKKATSVAVEAGLDRSIVSKWRRGQEAKADDVRSFTRSLGAPVVDAFLAAGFLQIQDTQITQIDRPLSTVADDELLTEIRRRMKGARDGMEDPAQQTAPSQAHQIEEDLDGPESSRTGVSRINAHLSREGLGVEDPNYRDKKGS